MGKPEAGLYGIPAWRSESGQLRERRERAAEEAMSELSFIIRKRRHWGAEGGVQGSPSSLQPEGLAAPGTEACGGGGLADSGRQRQVWAVAGQAGLSRFLVSLTFSRAPLQAPWPHSPCQALGHHLKRMMGGRLPGGWTDTLQPSPPSPKPPLSPPLLAAPSQPFLHTCHHRSSSAPGLGGEERRQVRSSGEDGDPEVGDPS